MRADARDPVATFEEARPRLRALAYRMLGSVEDAEDVVQETFVRWHAAPHAEVESPDAWLMAVCARLSVDALRAAYRKRESYLGPWLPEPVVTTTPDAPDPAELADSLSMAFLLLLERLSPLERAAFLLHDVFDYGYAEIAAVLNRSEAACRQLVSRARRNLRGEQRFPAAPARAADLLARFLAAARDGEVGQLEAMLARDAELHSDGGGEVAAATNVLRGADRVARFLAGVASKGGEAAVRPARVNGDPGAVILRGGRPIGVVTIALGPAGRIERVFLVVNPRKLRRVQLM